MPGLWLAVLEVVESSNPKLPLKAPPFPLAPLVKVNMLMLKNAQGPWLDKIQSLLSLQVTNATGNVSANASAMVRPILLVITGKHLSTTIPTSQLPNRMVEGKAKARARARVNSELAVVGYVLYTS